MYARKLGVGTRSEHNKETFCPTDQLIEKIFDCAVKKDRSLYSNWITRADEGRPIKKNAGQLNLDHEYTKNELKKLAKKNGIPVHGRSKDNYYQY